MKKVLFAALTFIVLLSSCSNDDIIIEKNDSINDVNVSVSLLNFFSSYNFYDTRHDIDVSEDYKTFYSEYKKYIQVRTLFYNNKGMLVDSLISYSTNTNEVNNTIKLSAGKYTVVSTLTFADEINGDKFSWWSLENKERLSTVALKLEYNGRWCIMSYSSKELEVFDGQTVNVNMDPMPIGALGYMYLQNFWCTNYANYPNISDNGVRELCLFTKDKAIGYKLDPTVSNKYIYNDDAGKNTWYFLSNRLEPTDFDDDWTFFKSNLYSYFYILAPQVHTTFGCVYKGETSFDGYGENTITIQNGKTYLAYWDYFEIGNPFFGIADNKHWNTYSSEAKNMLMRE